MNYPLSYYEFKDFPPLDEEEIELICKYDALDLVLLENANEALRIAIQSEGVFEYILENIVSLNPEYSYVRSETFPFYVNSILKQKYFDDIFPVPKENKREYASLVQNYRKEINLNKKLVMLIGVSLGTDGGHYAAFHYYKGTVEIFDSMQTTNKDKKSSHKSLGYYTPFFVQLAKDLFPGSKVHVPDCVKEEIALQLTGGFSGNEPLAVNRSKLSAEKKRILSIQSSESQNHFCYLWSLWYIHLRISGKNLSDIINIFEKVDPLVVIKRYAWCLIQTLKIEIDSRWKQFFYTHFLYIWSNNPLGNKLSFNFSRYKIPEPKSCVDALYESLQHIQLQLEENTPIPDDVCKRKRTKR